MSSGDLEYLGGRKREEEVGIEGFDQSHAKALERLRGADAFVLLIAERGPGTITVRFSLLIPEGEDYSEKMRLAFAESMERLIEDLRR